MYVESGASSRVSSALHICPQQSLAESAALTQAKMSRPELKEVEVVTGEENESNVFQVAGTARVLVQAQIC